jgi:hypothetical protein
MEKPFITRNMCLETHTVGGVLFLEGAVYTVENHGSIDWGHDYRNYKSEGVDIDISKFSQVHIYSGGGI